MAFLPDFDPSDVPGGRELIEGLTADAARIQQDVLAAIVARNAGTAYLRGFLDGEAASAGADVREAFKRRVPVVDYDDVKPNVDRIASGEASGVLCSEPVTDLLRSSGTSGRQQKLLPSTAGELDRKVFLYAVRALVRNLHLQTDMGNNGKGVYLMFSYPSSRTVSGLPIRSALTAYYNSDQFRNRDIGEFDQCTSPLEAVLCPDSKQGMYCQLLCGLLQRGNVDRVGASFAAGFVRGLKFLEEHWEEMCSNIRSGNLSEWVSDALCRAAVIGRFLRGPDPALADSIESECARKPWDGIVQRLWPRARYIRTTVTGSMEQYVPVLELYGGGLPLVSSMYGCTECTAGINLRPLDPPSDVSYAFLPNIAYFEFVEVGRDNGEKAQGEGRNGNAGEMKIVDLVDVEVGRCYELVVTTFAGLYRYRVGDLFTVTGFYNVAPLFRFKGRHGVVLSIDYEKTTEEDLLAAISKAEELHLRPLGYVLGGSTAYADISTSPGHYILFWELVDTCGGRGTNSGRGTDSPDRVVMESCCLAVEEGLDMMYRVARRRMAVGPLEVRVVCRGTFDRLMDFFVARGTSASQYKTPTCVQLEEAVSVLEERFVGRFFSQTAPDK